MENSLQQSEIVKSPSTSVGALLHDSSTDGPLYIRSATEGKVVLQDYKILDEFAKLAAESGQQTQEPSPVHFFAKDIYARWLEVSAGSWLAGRIHKFEHLFMLASGTAMILGGGVKTHVTGPWMSVSPAGSQRFIFAETDIVICTFHPNAPSTADNKDVMTCANGNEFFTYLKSTGQKVLGEN